MEKELKVKEDEFKSRLSEFITKEVVSKVSEFGLERDDKNTMTSSSFVKTEEKNKLRILELEEELFKEREVSRNLQMNMMELENSFKSKENSLKLTVELSENSYRDLWEKNSITNELYREQLRKNNELSEEIMQTKTNLNEKEEEISELKQMLESVANEKEIISEECKMWNEKYQSISRQCE